MQPPEEIRPGGLRPGHLRKQLGLLDSEAGARRRLFVSP